MELHGLVKDGGVAGQGASWEVGNGERSTTECFSIIYGGDSSPKFRNTICDPTVL